MSWTVRTPAESSKEPQEAGISGWKLEATLTTLSLQVNVAALRINIELKLHMTLFFCPLFSAFCIITLVVQRLMSKLLH